MTMSEQDNLHDADGTEFSKKDSITSENTVAEEQDIISEDRI